MKELRIYFSWSKFFIRVIIVVFLLPLFLVAGLLLSIRDYWKYKRYKCWYHPQTLSGYIIESLKAFSLTIGWFILGGFKTLKG
jgi:hypothetical protein